MLSLLGEVELTVIGLGLLLAALSAQYIVQRFRSVASHNPEFSAFQRVYLAGFGLVVLADCMQGPYLWRLVHEYGFLPSQIAALYVCSFTSSLFFGPVLGVLSDKLGRKFMSLAFCGLYATSCLTLFSRSYFILLVGRFIAGLSTSILYTAFESWMIAQHVAYGFPSEWLSRTLSLASLLSAFAAIVAGVLANIVSDFDGHHPSRPFVLGIISAGLAYMYIRRSWSGETGHGAPDTTSNQTCTGSLRTLVKDPCVWRLGAVQSLFETAVYGFAFFWTPAIDVDASHHAPLGFIYAAFAMAVMTGTFVFRKAVERKHSLTRIQACALGLACACLFLAALRSDAISEFICLVGFELSLGIILPCLATLRSELIPEVSRYLPQQ